MGTRPVGAWALLLLASDPLLAQTAAGANPTALITHEICVASTRRLLGMFVGDYRVQAAYRVGPSLWDSTVSQGHFAWELGGCLLIERLQGWRGGEPYAYVALWGTSGPADHRVQRAFAHSQHGVLDLMEGRWNSTMDTLILGDSVFVGRQWMYQRFVISRPEHGSFVVEERRSEDGGHTWFATRRATYTKASSR
jgi:hypothetical protein